LLSFLFKYLIVYPFLIGLAIGFIGIIIKGIFGWSSNGSSYRSSYNYNNNYVISEGSSNRTSSRHPKSGRIVYRGQMPSANPVDYGRSNIDGSWEKDGVIFDSDFTSGIQLGNRTYYDDGSSSTRVGDYEFFD